MGWRDPSRRTVTGNEILEVSTRRKRSFRERPCLERNGTGMKEPQRRVTVEESFQKEWEAGREVGRNKKVP